MGRFKVGQRVRLLPTLVEGTIQASHTDATCTLYLVEALEGLSRGWSGWVGEASLIEDEADLGERVDLEADVDLEVERAAINARPRLPLPVNMDALAEWVASAQAQVQAPVQAPAQSFPAEPQPAGDLRSGPHPIDAWVREVGAGLDIAHALYDWLYSGPRDVPRTMSKADVVQLVRLFEKWEQASVKSARVQADQHVFIGYRKTTS